MSAPRKTPDGILAAGRIVQSVCVYVLFSPGLLGAPIVIAGVARVETFSSYWVLSILGLILVGTGCCGFTVVLPLSDHLCHYGYCDVVPSVEC